MMLFSLVTFWVAFGLLVYTQIGYPLLSAIASQLPNRRPSTCTLPHVTLIIPAHNEEQVIKAKLENSLALDYPSSLLEIMVASDGSTDRSNQIASAYSDRGVKLLAFSQRRGKASVLNDAVAQAIGGVVCLCDANVMFARDALRQLVSGLAEPRVGAVCGDVRLASEQANFGVGENLYYRVERAVQLGESRLGSIMGVDGGMYVLRKELFSPLPPDTILDDFVISMQVISSGHYVLYDPKAVATENATPLAKQEFRRRMRITAGAVQSLKRGHWPRHAGVIVLWQYLSHKLLRWFNPLLCALLLACNIVVADEHLFYRMMLGAQAVICFIAMFSALSLRVRGTRWGGIVFYFCMSQLAMAVGLINGLFNRQSVTWAKSDRSLVRPETRGV